MLAARVGGADDLTGLQSATCDPELAVCGDTEYTPRRIANLSAICARNGINSQISIQGTSVWMGSNSPRYRLGAAGFISYTSRWDGPPLRWIMMTDFCADCAREGDSARKRNTSPRTNPLSVHFGLDHKRARDFSSSRRDFARRRERYTSRNLPAQKDLPVRAAQSVGKLKK